MRSKHDIKNLTAISYFVPRMTPKTKLEGIPSRCRRRYILSEDYSIATNFFKRLTKVLLGIPMDPILSFLGRAGRELSENTYFYPALLYSF